jgi:hypothetical protein
MGHPLSCNLRDRALAAVDAGLSWRGAAERFGVSAACRAMPAPSRRAATSPRTGSKPMPQ